MLNQSKEIIKRHIKTHTERSADDQAAVSVLKTFLRSNGKINTSFAEGDKWPNHDGAFEFVPNPDVSRQPKQNFFVQIKGTQRYTEKDGIVKYSLKDLAFPAFICLEVSLDPGILFVVLNPEQRGSERVFWKYMSVDFLNYITVDVDISLTERDCKGDDIEYIETVENGTRIRFTVYAYESGKTEEEDDTLRIKSVVPFQLAYAVSIHKAQGLEYDSVKVIIPSVNTEKITHGVFYTAITRAKKNLKIYWSSETMHDVVKGFAVDESKHRSKEIVKAKLSSD